MKKTSVLIVITFIGGFFGLGLNPAHGGNQTDRRSIERTGRVSSTSWKNRVDGSCVPVAQTCEEALTICEDKAEKLQAVVTCVSGIESEQGNTLDVVNFTCHQQLGMCNEEVSSLESELMSLYEDNPKETIACLIKGFVRPDSQIAEPVEF